MILYPELTQFKKEILPQCKVGVEIVDRINDVLSATYEQLLPNEVPQNTAMLLADVRNSLKNAKHNIQHIISSVSLIGADQHDRYFAFKDGEFQEISKEDFPPDDDTSTTPEG